MVILIRLNEAHVKSMSMLSEYLNWCSNLDTYFFQLFSYIIQDTFMKKKLTKGFFFKKRSCGQEWFEVIFIFLQSSSGVCCVWGLFLFVCFLCFKLLFKE